MRQHKKRIKQLSAKAQAIRQKRPFIQYITENRPDGKRWVLIKGEGFVLELPDNGRANETAQEEN